MILSENQYRPPLNAQARLNVPGKVAEIFQASADSAEIRGTRRAKALLLGPRAGQGAEPHKKALLNAPGGERDGAS